MTLYRASGGPLLKTSGGGLVKSPDVAPTGKSLLQSSDFSYLGSFCTADLYPTYEGDIGYCRGLTHRYNGATLELFSSAYGGDGRGAVFSMTVPTLKTSATYNHAPLVRHWGDVYHGKKLIADGPGGDPQGITYGLYWDEPTSRLYWVYMDDYSSNMSETSIGYSTLNDSDGSSVAYGPWGFTEPGYKCMKGITAIPSEWQSYVGGKRLAAGFGGYESVVGSGGGSMGPSLTAFDPATMTALTEGDYLAAGDVQTLVHHAVNTTPYTRPMRGKRDTNYYQETDGWDVNAGVGYWTWSDSALQSGIWISTATKEGFMVLVRQMDGVGTATVDGTFTPTAAPAYGVESWNVRVTSAYPGLNVGDYVSYPVVVGGAAAARIEAISGVDLVITMVPSGLVPDPEPATSGTTYRGSFYYGSTVYSSAGKVQAFMYAPEDLVAGTDVDLVAYSHEWTFGCPTIPGYIEGWKDVGRGTIGGVTFDDTTGLLYVMFPQGIYEGGYPKSVISVYSIAT